MNYFDFETINQCGVNGGPANPFSFAYGSGATHKEFIINPSVTGVTDFIDHTQPGGWASQYQGAYQVHGLNVDELSKPTQGRIVLNTRAEVHDALRDYLANADGETAGFFNTKFDDPIMQGLLEDAPDDLKDLYNKTKRVDVRKYAHEVLGRAGESEYEWYRNMIRNTNSKTTNEELALLLGVDLSDTTLHQATDDIKVTEALHAKLKRFDELKQSMKSANSKQQWYSGWLSMKREFGAQVQSLAVTDELIDSGTELGIDTEKVRKKVEAQRIQRFKGGIREEFRQKLSKEELYYLNKSIVDKKIKNGYTKSSTSTGATEQSLLKSLYRQIDSLGDAIHTKTGISKSIQSKAAIAGGIIAGVSLLHSALNSQSDEEEQKLQTMNQRVNGNEGDYTKY